MYAANPDIATATPCLSIPSLTSSNVMYAINMLDIMLTNSTHNFCFQLLPSRVLEFLVTNPTIPPIKDTRKSQSICLTSSGRLTNLIHHFTCLHLFKLTCSSSAYFKIIILSFITSPLEFGLTGSLTSQAIGI